MLHSQKLDGNANFPTTKPSFTDLQNTAADLAKTIMAIEGGDISRIPHRNTVMLEAENMIRQLSYDIQNQSMGDEEKIKSAGFAVRKGKGASQPVGLVTKFKTKALGNGKVKLSWKRFANSDMNFIEVTDNPVTGVWKPIAKTHRSSFIMEELIAGQVYYFRVYGSNSLGDGNPSEPAEQRVM